MTGAFDRRLTAAFAASVVRDLIESSASAHVNSPVVFDLLTRIHYDSDLIGVDASTNALAGCDPVFADHDVRHSVRRVAYFRVVRRDLDYARACDYHVAATVNVVLAIR